VPSIAVEVVAIALLPLCRPSPLSPLHCHPVAVALPIATHPLPVRCRCCHGVAIVADAVAVTIATTTTA
jgi:hypothetical protein